MASRYRLSRLLGVGGMGAVYEAEHLGLRTGVALKMLHPELATDAEVLERFRREAQRVAALRHPGIVTVLDYGQDEHGAPFIALELLRGESLQDVLERQGPLPIAGAVDVVAHVLEALSYAHGQGVVHRDLKAANVFLAKGTSPGESPRVKVVDFGIAKATTDRERLTRTGMILGSPEMMPPEQVVSAGHVDARADVYSAGALLFQLLTGTPPATGTTVFEIVSRVARGDIERHPRSRRGDVPPWLDAVVAMALAHEPAERFQSAEGMRRALVTGAGSLNEPSGGRLGTVPMPASAPAVRPDSTPIVPLVTPARPRAVLRGAGGTELVAPTEAPAPAPILDVQHAPQPKRGGRALMWIALALLLAGLLVGGFVVAGRARLFRPRESSSAEPSSSVPLLPPPPAPPLPPSAPPSSVPTLVPSTALPVGTPTLVPSMPPPPPPLVPSGPAVPSYPSPPSMPVPQGPTAMPIDGLWRGDFGLMAFRTVSPGVVRGVYPHDRGTLTGTMTGNQLRGWWCEIPSRAPNADAGEFEMRFAASGMSVDGRWRYGTDGVWREDWNLRRISVELPADLAARFDDAGSFCGHP